MSAYLARTEIDNVIHGLQTGRYRFLDQKAQQIQCSDGNTLNANFNDAKYTYIMSLRQNPFSHEVLISEFLKWINEAKKCGVLVDDESFGLDHIDIETEKLVETIIVKLNVLNTLSKKQLGYELFNNDAYTMRGLRYTCNSPPEFVYRVASIAFIIDNLRDKDNISKTLRNRPKEERSINIIESFFKEKNVKAEQPVDMLRNLYLLRSKTPPIHASEHDAIDVLQKIGISYPIEDWVSAGEKCLRYFLKTLDLLCSSLTASR